jgi:hypothetical protein
MHGAIVLSFVGLLLSGPLAAQQALPPSEIEIGARVRASVPAVQPGRLIGTVTALDVRALHLTTEPAGEPLTLPWSEIATLDRSLGASRGTGALIGAAAGTAAGILGGLLMAVTLRDAAFAPIGGAVVGMPVGTLLGLAIAPERWQRVLPPRYPL